MSGVKGLYVSPTKFVSFAERDKRRLTDEIASRGNTVWGFGSFFGMLPNPDPILKAAGMDIRAYRDLRVDPLIGSAIRRRKSSVKALERGFNEGDTDTPVCEFLKDMMASWDMDAIIGGLLDAPLFGWQPAELMWVKDNGRFTVSNIVAKPPEWFHFDTDNRLRFRGNGGTAEGILPPDYKFICPTQDATYDNPYGFADLSMCFWPGMFKKHGWRFWMQFVEKYATPWAVGKHARGATQSDIDQLMDGLEQMVQDAIAVIPEGDSVEIKEPMGKSASSDIFRAMITMARAEISIALLGQNQTTEAETNKASAQAGLEVTDDIRDGDAAIVTGAINQVLRWAAELNFGDVPVPVWNLWEQETIDDTQAKRDQTLSQTRGFFTPQYYEREYGLQPGDLNPQVLMSPSSPWGQMPLTGQPSLGFAEAAAKADSDVRDKLDDALSSVSDTLMNDDVMAPLLAPVFEMVRNGATPTDIMGRLASLYPQMNGDELVERLAKVRFLAKVMGIYHAHSQ
ncbi:DUF935 family protein [Salmonella enterica]|uniref:DUF935 domain-containing protein n=1 Tax=Salmonella enterica TaxID=28901 RepID=UPI0012D57D52|nr:DUF935 family protein [Salmonella enterica]ECD6161997.1 DUF935 family protein [Salmonella enterica subsp. enterica]ECU7995162.1 DUF935 family protein [Salmonella enterica subsp. enterica serovar Toucra]EAW3045209.1 DUF935 family protein [Salmonella enterica]EAW3064066.1 DUF935 family protein [Salmonella enterica]